MPPQGHGPFAVLNRTGNPALGLILRSPAHRLVSRRLALITVTGRRTGREHTFPVEYQREAERVTIHVMWPERKVWWRNLRDAAPVTLRLRGEERTGSGVAHEHQDGKVDVTVALDPPA